MNNTLSGIAIAIVMAATPNVSSAKLLSVCDGITIHDNSGSVYVFTQNETELDITVNKTEPEGIFRYYDTTIPVSKDKESVYRMDLSCCEYLVDTGEYASCYTITIDVPGRHLAEYSQDILIKDSGFEDLERCQYYFYVTAEISEKSGSEILGSNEYVTEDGIQICEQYVRIFYTEALTGDVNEDGKVNITDAANILECYAGLSAGLDNKAYPDSADVDGNGKVEIMDASSVLVYYAQNAVGVNSNWYDILK